MYLEESGSLVAAGEEAVEVAIDIGMDVEDAPRTGTGELVLRDLKAFSHLFLPVPGLAKCAPPYVGEYWSFFVCFASSDFPLNNSHLKTNKDLTRQRQALKNRQLDITCALTAASLSINVRTSNRLEHISSWRSSAFVNKFVSTLLPGARGQGSLVHYIQCNELKLIVSRTFVAS